MHHVVELHFDDATELKLAELTRTIRSARLDISETICGIRPHITLGSCEPLKLDSLGPKLAELFSHFHPIEVRFSSVGLFSKTNGNFVAYLGPTASLTLCQWHLDLFRLLDAEGVKSFDFTRPEAAVFHCTLSNDLPQARLSEAIEIAGSYIPLSGRIIRGAVVEYFPARERIGFDFKGDA